MIRELSFFSIALAVAATTFAATGTAGLRNSQPIKIKSDELVTDTSKRTATFSGKVSARQGDMTIYADKLVIRYSSQDQDVDTVEATGNVKIVQGDRQAIAGHAVYDNKAGTIVLDTSPKVYQGDNILAGKVITYFVEEQRTLVTGGGVEAEIHPRQKGKNGSARP